MANLHKAFYFLLLLLLCTADAAAEPLSLPFRQGLSMLFENNLELGVQRLEPKIAEARVRSAQGAFDPALFGSFARQDTSTPLSARSSVAAGGLRSVESESYDLQAGLTGTTTFGTEYTLQVNSNWTADTFSGFEYEYDSFTGVSIRQPLLRDYGDANLLEIRLAQKDREISVQQTRRVLLDAVSAYGDAWWALAEARGALDVRLESLKLAEVLLEANRKKLEAGVISRLDLVQAEAAVASRKEDVLIAERNLQAAERTLKELIAADAYAIKDRDILPIGDSTLKPIGQSLQESIARALDSRPEYEELRATIERSNIAVKYRGNQTFPELDLEASYGYNGLGDSFSDSFSSIDENPEWRLGLAFRYPLGNRTERAELEAARLEALQSRIRLKRLEQEIVLRLDESMKEVSTVSRRLEAAEDAVRLAAETLSAEEKKLAAGRSTTFNVLRIQDDLLLSRLKRLDAVSGYNTALLRFYREKGTLLEELGINLKDISEAR